MTMDYFIDEDANNEPTIWRGTRDDSAPQAVVTQWTFLDDPELWEILRAGIVAKNRASV